MRSNSLRLAAALAGVALFSAACSTDSPDPTEPNLAAGVVIKSFVVESDATFHPFGCTPEPVALHFRTAYRFQTVLGDRRLIDKFQAVERGGSGVGTETGTLYRVAGGSREIFTTGENGTFTVVTFQNYVSQGSAGNFMARLQLHFTMTPDGNIVVDIDRFDAAC
jgi:hypothetical protein